MINVGSLWKALADDNRRQILLILKKKDMIPTEIAKHFNFTLVCRLNSSADFEGCRLIDREETGKKQILLIK